MVVHYTPVKGHVFRIVALDGAGLPLCGADPDAAVMIDSGPTRVVPSARVDTARTPMPRDDTTDVRLKPSEVRQLRVCVTIEPESVHPTVLAHTLLSPHGGPAAEDIPGRFSLEVWQPVTGAGAQDPDTGRPRWVYSAWPNLGQALLDDVQPAGGLRIVAESAQASPLWWIGGPWLGREPVWPIPGHWLQRVTTTPPPPATGGVAGLPCPSLTSGPAARR